MVALPEVLDEELPVGRDVVLDPVRPAQGLEPVPLEVGPEPPELRPERQRVLRQIEPHEPAPHGDVDGVQGEVRLPEVRDPHHVGRSLQVAVEAVGPRVVRARDPVTGEPAAGRLAEHGASVPAHVVEGVDLSGLVAHDDDALAGHVAEGVLPRLRPLLEPPGAEPHPVEEPLPLALVDRGIDVVAALEARGQAAQEADAERLLDRGVARLIVDLPDDLGKPPFLTLAHPASSPCAPSRIASPLSSGPRCVVPLLSPGRRGSQASSAFMRPVRHHRARPRFASAASRREDARSSLRAA